MSTCYQQMKRHKRIGKALLATPVLMGGLLLGSWNGPVEPETGVQSDGTYRVVDLDSHLAMCTDTTFNVEDRTACQQTAYETWN